MKYLVVLAILFTSPSIAATLKEQATIDREQVVVGDLFDDAGDAAAQPVGSAPAPGGKNTYDVSALNRVARAYNLQWQPANLNVKTIVTRAATKVSTALIQDAVRAALASQTTQAAKYDVQLDRRLMEINLPASQHIAAVRLVDPTYDPKGYRFNGTLMVDLEGGEAPSVTPVSGRAVPQYDVPVIAKAVQPGTVLAESDLNYVTMAADRINADLVRDIEQLKGKEVRRSLIEGSTISQRDLRPTQLVKRGNMVTMIVKNGALQITVKGRALGDGAQGDTLKVMNEQSKKVVEGTVNASGDVQIIGNS